MTTPLSTFAPPLHQGTDIFNQKGFDASPEAIRNWIRALPLGDLRATIQLTLDALRRLNHRSSLVPTDERIQALALLTPLINTLAKRLIAHHCTKSRHRFTWQKNAHIDTMQRLLGETVHSYQTIISESPLLQQLGTVPETNISDSDTCHLDSAACHAAEHLAQRLLLSYLVYAEPPQTVWSALHRLYALAETRGVAATLFNTRAANDTQQRKRALEHLYKRTLLLSLANPYHLMPSEVTRAYQALRRWAPQCRIIGSDSPDTLQGRFYIDLESDLPPRHYSLNQKQTTLSSLRLLDISGILPASCYQETLDRRLAQALIVRPERLARRTQAHAGVTLAGGMAACHHFVGSARQEEPGRHDNQPPPRLDRRNPITIKMASRATHHDTFDAQQKDVGLGGLAVRHNAFQHHLPTGALLTFRSDTDHHNGHWNIGTVRWSRNHPDKGYELGIKCLAEDARPVVTRIDGDGDAPYHHSLLTPDVDPLIHPTTLITPAGRYKLGDTVQIHVECRRLRAELTQLIENTWDFSHYRFRLIASEAH